MNAKIHALNLSSGWYLNNWICSERGKLRPGWSLQHDANAVARLGFDGVKLVRCCAQGTASVRHSRRRLLTWLWVRWHAGFW
jgi:hypothetical protein